MVFEHMQVRAAIVEGVGGFSLESIDMGDLQGDEVLVGIRASGICYTDHAALWRLGDEL